MLVLHIPHSSAVVPSHVRDQLLATGPQLDRELLLMTDHYVDELFALPIGEATTVRYEVSRLVCDPERFEDDDDEPMAACGMGAVYTATQDGAALRREIAHGEREALLARFYRPHHDRLTQAVTDELAATGTCLIVDAHSFPRLPLPYETDQCRGRPQVCLGTDPDHTPLWLEVAAYDAFAERFGSVVVNKPFAGALVPLRFYRRDTRVRSLMVEVRRDLYMDEATGEKLPGFEDVAARLREAVREVAAERWLRTPG